MDEIGMMFEEFEQEDACDVPEDSIFILGDDGEVTRLEVPDDNDGDDQA